MVTSDMDYKVSIVHLKAPLGDNVTPLSQPFGVQSGLTLETSALKLYTMANFHYQLNQ